VSAVVPNSPLYLRGEQLSPQDRRGLEDYYALLRRHWNIPTDQPVFADREAGAARTPARILKRSRHRARNAANHPWRAVVGRSRP